MKVTVVRAWILVVGLLGLCSQSSSDELVNSWLKELDPALKKRVSEAGAESQKDQTLLRECIQFCRPQSADTYQIHKLVDCSMSESRSLAERFADNRCTHQIKASISVYTKVVNRFGEVAWEESDCRWAGHNYDLTATCGASSGKSKQDSDASKRLDLPQYVVQSPAQVERPSSELQGTPGYQGVPGDWCLFDQAGEKLTCYISYQGCARAKLKDYRCVAN